MTVRPNMRGLMRFFRTAKHPVTRCIRAKMKEGVSKRRAEKICAKAKDMALGTTKWRAGKTKALKS